VQGKRESQKEEREFRKAMLKKRNSVEGPNQQS
jgi:hypothetical protein